MDDDADGARIVADAARPVPFRVCAANRVAASVSGSFASGMPSGRGVAVCVGWQADDADDPQPAQREKHRRAHLSKRHCTTGVDHADRPHDDARMADDNLLVLVADDEPAMRELVADHLRQLENPKLDVIVAENGEQALTLARDRLPDLVVLDVMMPRNERLGGVQANPRGHLARAHGRARCSRASARK